MSSDNRPAQKKPREQAPAAIKHERTFTLDKETKNTVRYNEDQDEEPIVVNTIYIQKWALGKTPPKQIRVTIEEI